MEPDVFKRPEQQYGGTRHSNRRSNHIVRHRPDMDGPIILQPTRVAKPVTVNTTPEQARQAAIIASEAFQPVMSAPKLSDQTPPILNQVPPEGEEIEEPRSSTAKTVIIVLSILVVLLAGAAAAGFYLALHKG